MLEFRHDRILEFFVAGALSTMLADAAPIDPSAVLLKNTMPPWLDAIPIVPSAKCQFPAGVSSPN